jgi:hypothetical protein
MQGVNKLSHFDSIQKQTKVNYMSKENENTAVEPKALSFDQMMELQSIGDEVDAINETKICGVVTKIDALPTSEKTNKDGTPKLDENGHPTFFDPMFWVSIGITGDDDGCVLSADQLNEVEVGKKYVFVGYRKGRKFRVSRIISKQDYVASIARQKFGI